MYQIISYFHAQCLAELFHKAVSKVMLGTMLIKGSHVMKTNTVERALSTCSKLDIFLCHFTNLFLISQASECLFLVLLFFFFLMKMSKF